MTNVLMEPQQVVYV